MPAVLDDSLGTRAMSPAESKALVRRFYEEIDKGNLAAMDELVAENYVDHNPPPFPGIQPGLAGLKRVFEVFLAATPGYIGSKIRLRRATRLSLVSLLSGRMKVRCLALPLRGEPSK